MSARRRPTAFRPGDRVRSIRTGRVGVVLWPTSGLCAPLVGRYLPVLWDGSERPGSVDRSEVERVAS